jgi:hypothetical protein
MTHQLYLSTKEHLEDWFAFPYFSKLVLFYDLDALISLCNN